MASRSRTRLIALLGYPQLTTLDLAGPAEVFATAAALAAKPAARPLYEVMVLGLDRQPFRAESGLVFVPDAAMADAPALDTLIVPGGRGLRDPERLGLIAPWLRRRQRGFRRIAAVCTGAWALAEAGLLDGLRVTTHWRHADALALAYPRIRVEPDKIYIRQEGVYTSAGITAGIDLALALVEEDHGPSLALAVARELVVHLKRAGGQRQFSERLSLSTSADSPLAELNGWMLDNLAEDLCLARLAARCHISPRQLARRFKAAFGTTPAKYVERLRMDEASQLLLSGRHGLDRVAAAVGFRSADVFRRAFERRFGVTPIQFRARFVS
jgi:transcriptional regulator GlxA family with amidase domain